MGCGESKHAVATQNTVIKNPSKRTNSIKKNSLETDPVVEKKGSTNNDGIIENGTVPPVEESAPSVVKESGNGNVVEQNEIPDKVKEEEIIKDDIKEKEPENVEKGKENIIEGIKDEKPEEKVNKGSNDVVEGKEIINGEDKSKTEIKEAPKIEEDKAVVPSDEPKSSATTEEEKTPAVEEKNENAPSVDDAKAV